MTDLSVSSQDLAVHSGDLDQAIRGGRGGQPDRRQRHGRWRSARHRAVRPGVLLAIVLAGQFMAVLDASVVNVAAPSIHAGLHASGAGLQLVIAGYTIAYAVLLVALRFVQGVGAAIMIPQVLSLIQRTFTGTSRARAMSAYSAVLAGGVVVGQIAGGLLISADLLGAAWRPVFLVNVPIGVVLLASGWRMLPAGPREPGRGLDILGLLTLSPAVLALVVPLVLGQPEHWPAWGWASMAGSAVLLGCFVLTERRLAARGGFPLVPGRILRLPGVAAGIGSLFAVMSVFGGMFFALALELQSGLGESPLRAGLTFAPSALMFAVVSLNWQRLPGQLRPWLAVGGSAGMAVGLLTLASLLHGGGTGGPGLYVALGFIGACMAAAFSPLMTA